MKKTSIVISIIAALLLGASVQADMITMGGDQTAGTGTLTINYDLVFTITANSSGQIAFIFDEIVATDEGPDFATFSGLEYSINGGSNIAIDTWVDNLNEDFEDVTLNDGYIFGVEEPSLTIGDTITLHAGTGTMSTAMDSFNPWSNGDYDVFITDFEAVRISSVVPEPATAGLLGISAIVLFGIRKFYGRF